jgi:hypothetical protein
MSMLWIFSFIHGAADYASVFGLATSLLGFAITITVAVRSKSVAERVGGAVADVRSKLALQASVVDLHRIIAEIDDLKFIHRAGAWEVLPSRYSAVRKQILSLKARDRRLSRAHKSALQSVVQKLSAIEADVERSLAGKLAGNAAKMDPAALNHVIAVQSDKLSTILNDVQRNIGAP